MDSTLDSPVTILHEAHVTYLASLQMVNALRDQFVAVAQQLITNADAETSKQLLGYMYWEAPAIPVSLVSEALGVKDREIQQVVGIYLLPVNCSNCQTESHVEVKSRNQLVEIQRALKSTKPSRQFHYLCSPCQSENQAKNKESSARWEAERREQAERYGELHTMPYREYLQTPEWQQTRIACLKRARFRCQVCNTGEQTLNVHHRTYERRGYEENADLIVLCHECHQIFHDKGELAHE